MAFVYLWVLQERFFIVEATSLSIRRTPLRVQYRLAPSFVEREERRVDHSTHRQQLEVEAEVVKRHPK